MFCGGGELPFRQCQFSDSIGSRLSDEDAIAKSFRELAAPVSDHAAGGGRLVKATIFAQHARNIGSVDARVDANCKHLIILADLGVQAWGAMVASGDDRLGIVDITE